MLQLNGKNDILATQPYSLNKPFNMNNIEAMFNKNLRKKALVLPRKNISDNAIDCNELDLIVSSSASYNQKNAKKTPSKQIRDSPILSFYGSYLKEVVGFKSPVKDTLLICLQEKLKEKLEARKSKRQYEAALKQNNKMIFYKTQARDAFWEKNRRSKLDTSFKTIHNNEQMLMPLATQMQYIQRNYKNITQTPKKFHKTRYKNKIIEVATHNKLQSDRKFFNNSSFIKDNKRTKNLRLNEFKLLKMNLTKNMFMFSSQESSSNYRKVPKRLVIKKNTGSTISLCRLNILSYQKPKTPKNCHKTKRILFCPRLNTEYFPLLIFNFEGVLGDVYQDSFSEQGRIYYVVKPRTFYMTSNRTRSIFEPIDGNI